MVASAAALFLEVPGGVLAGTPVQLYQVSDDSGDRVSEWVPVLADWR